MKITLERLREIITEEVIKEEVAPEDAQRTIVALLQGTAQNVTGDIMGAVYDEMYASDVAEPEEEEMRRSIRSPGQEEAPLVSADPPEQKTIPGFVRERRLDEIIHQEYYIYMIQEHQRLLKEAAGPTGAAHGAHLKKAFPSDAMDKQRKRASAREKARHALAAKDEKARHALAKKDISWQPGAIRHPKTGERMRAPEWAKLIISMYPDGPPERGAREFQSSFYVRDPESPSGWRSEENPNYVSWRPHWIAEDDWYLAHRIKDAGFPSSPDEFYRDPRPPGQDALGHPLVPLPDTMTQWNKTNLNDLVNIWDKYIKGGGDIRAAVEKTQIEGEKITDALAALYSKLTADANIQQHAR